MSAQTLWHWCASDCAVDALGRLGPAAAPAVPALMAMMENDEVVDEDVVDALGAIGPAAAAALDKLRICRTYYSKEPERIEKAIRRIEGREA